MCTLHYCAKLTNPPQETACEMGRKKREHNEEFISKAVGLYRSGMSHKEVAEAICMSYSNAYRLLRQHTDMRPRSCGKPSPEARFWKKVKKGNSCWEWTGTKDDNGYGRMARHGNKQVRTHRVSWELHHGTIPPGAIVMHACDNPSCVNPAHLRLGSVADNSLDCVMKCRQSSKLNSETVTRIRKALQNGGVSQRDIGDAYGVDQSTISNLVTRKTWKHCP